MSSFIFFAIHSFHVEMVYEIVSNTQFWFWFILFYCVIFFIILCHLLFIQVQNLTDLKLIEVAFKYFFMF